MFNDDFVIWNVIGITWKKKMPKTLKFKLHIAHEYIWDCLEATVFGLVANHLS
jgi:hypothetical protein